MDFVSAWKAVSVGLTAAFGLLGLLTEFKQKGTGKITRWGTVSLIGILISGILGVMAQLREFSDQEVSRKTTAQETLSLAQKTDHAVRDIQRVLSPLSDPNFNFGFEVPCSNTKYREFCLRIGKLKPYERASTSDWDEWPSEVTLILVHLAFFADEKDAQLYMPKAEGQWDLHISIVANQRDKSLWAWRLPDDNKILICGTTDRDSAHDSALSIKTNGRIKSVLDLPGTTMFISQEFSDESAPTLNELRLDYFKMSVNNNQAVDIDIDRFERVTLGKYPAYRYVFPQKSK